jgi:hypothetical protein
MNYDPNNILNSEETNFVKLSVYQSLEAENARLKAEVERLTAFTTRTIIPNEQLQSEIEILKGKVNYWKIEAECDHGRWMRTLEDLEHLRRLK